VVDLILVINEAYLRMAVCHRYYAQSTVLLFDNCNKECETWIQLNDRQSSAFVFFQYPLTSAISVGCISLILPAHSLHQSNRDDNNSSYMYHCLYNHIQAIS